MDLKSKIAYTDKHIESIARHDEVDLAVRNAALDRVIAKVEEERKAAAERVAASIAETLGEASEAG